MPISTLQQTKIDTLKREFEKLRRGKEDLLEKVDEAEIPESVYNSNAIENSTLTLKETERILLEMEADRDLDLREIFEAKNLARVMGYIRNKLDQTSLDKDFILLLHKMLLDNINEKVAGRFRQKHEYVRVGTHIAPAPEHVEQLIEQLLIDYEANVSSHILERISHFHLEFERIHPFVDGNGRIGRTLINYLLMRSGFPPVIIRNRGKKEDYYPSFREYIDDNSTKRLDRLMVLAVMESFHKRLAYLNGQEIIKLSEAAKKNGRSVPALLNAARRQTIPAFREKNVWKIGKNWGEL